MTETTNNQYVVLLSRVALAVILLAHGYAKIFIYTIPGTIGYFESMGLPSFTVYLTLFGEMAAGTAILIGLYTRLAALLSIPILIGAVGAHAANGWIFSNPGGGWEFPLLLVVLAVIVAIQGGGSFAIRRLPIIDAFIPEKLKA